MKQYIKYTAILVGLVFSISTASAQKGAERLAGAKPPTNAKPAAGNAKLFRSHVKQIGVIGPAEVYAVKVQSFHGPTLSTALLYNTNTMEFLVLGTAVDNGIAKTLLGAGAQVGSAYLWGSSLRPNKQTINNGSLSASGSKATGGSAVSVSDADATNTNTNTDTNTNANANTNADTNTNVNTSTQGQAQGQQQQQQGNKNHHND